MLTISGDRKKVDEENTDFSTPNPFAVRYTRPEVVPYFFERSFVTELRNKYPKVFQEYFARSLMEDTNVANWIGIQFLADMLAGYGYWGQIIGPHGSGKTTLLYDLTQILQQRGCPVLSIALHDQQKNIPPDFRLKLLNLAKYKFGTGENGKTPSSMNKIVIIDGFEQLSCLNAFFLRCYCLRQNLGMLVTAHKAAYGFPVLYKTHSSTQQLEDVINFLLEDSDMFLKNQELPELLQDNKGNIRDVLFLLYDEYEDRKKVFSIMKTGNGTHPR